MKIRLLTDLAVDEKHGMVEGRELDVVRIQNPGSRLNPKPKYIVVGNMGKEVYVYRHEAELVSKQAMGNGIIRSRVEVEALLRGLTEEVDDPRIVFGKEEAREYIRVVEGVLAGNIPADDENDATYWLMNEKGTLGRDYGVEVF